ncbi:LysR family transcriptional regulator [Acidovorax sp. SUPP2522]|uniref:LysR family transcriptional regulator n=1 Tax=unclassified Acidovorax TaxID=2684926 RepID=UPI00234AF370|nr:MULTISPECIES: LysR family transcriptional regulator [unclassified Acidovorax]WCM99632.1 LysR family transcriptional regulator [Acidovorax sp. GBBC 1281]GKT19072.1 LysR family transcriptional regulator [Acidovorax sp. SUPP2522]
MILQTSLLRFQEIAHSGSIRAASERLFITPSALSRELQKLEEDLGVTLFERRARGMVLTAAGKVYLNHVRDALNDIERMRSELDALQNLHRGHVSILSVEGYASDFLAPAIAQFQDNYPNITFSLRITGASAVVSGIGSGEADIGLVFNLQPTEELHSVLHLHVPLLAVMAPGHPLAARNSLTLSQLVSQRLALPDTSFGVRRLIDLQSQLSKVRIAPALEANSLAVLRGFARSGGGITLLSRMSIRSELAAGQLVGIPLADTLLSQGGIDVCTLGHRKLPVAAAAFLDHLIRTAHTAE